MEEEFRKIPNYSNYSASTLGKIQNDSSGRILKQSSNNLGYLFVTLRNDQGISLTLRVHRLVATTFIPNNDPNKNVVDHINNNPSDNRVDNLRWCSQRENSMNCSLGKNNTSGVKGVSFYKLTGKWSAYIWNNRKKIYLGSFDTIEEAAAARRRVAEQNFGEYLNACELAPIINIQNLNINN